MVKPIVSYLRNAFTEIGKISWPNRKQTIRLTVAVLVFSAVFGLFIGFIDLGLAELVKRVIVKG